MSKSGGGENLDEIELYLPVSIDHYINSTYNLETFYINEKIFPIYIFLFVLTAGACFLEEYVFTLCFTVPYVNEQF